MDRFGGPEVLVLRDVADPVPGDGEVLVEVAAAGVSRVDTAVRRGQGPPHLAAAPPYVPGGAVTGTVAGIGTGVDPALRGRRVAARAAGGGYAERVVVPASELVTVPDGVGSGAAAALLDDGATALGLLERTPVRRGEHVLVLPAGCGPGSLLVQLVASAGGRVIGAVRGADRHDRVRALGAEHVVDHARPGWVAEVHALVPHGPAVVFDGVGGTAGRAAAWLVADGGRYSSFGTAGGPAPELGPCEERSRRLTTVGPAQLADLGAEVPRRAREVLALAAAGQLRPLVGAEYPLADAARAHADLERGRTAGTVVLRP
ncbi:zinc-binding dehydrogenase [Pseudonocardia sp. C8]|nr:zinc-binding dehydrogenase [Pseudonocardia sp. C8]